MAAAGPPPRHSLARPARPETVRHPVCRRARVAPAARQSSGGGSWLAPTPPRSRSAAVHSLVHSRRRRSRCRGYPNTTLRLSAPSVVCRASVPSFSTAGLSSRRASRTKACRSATSSCVLDQPVAAKRAGEPVPPDPRCPCRVQRSTTEATASRSADVAARRLVRIRRSRVHQASAIPSIFCADVVRYASRLIYRCAPPAALALVISPRRRAGAMRGGGPGRSGNVDRVSLLTQTHAFFRSSRKAHEEPRRAGSSSSRRREMDPPGRRADQDFGAHKVALSSGAMRLQLRVPHLAGPERAGTGIHGRHLRTKRRLFAVASDNVQGGRLAHRRLPITSSAAETADHRSPGVESVQTVCALERESQAPVIRIVGKPSSDGPGPRDGGVEAHARPTNLRACSSSMRLAPRGRRAGGRRPQRCRRHG